MSYAYASRSRAQVVLDAAKVRAHTIARGISPKMIEVANNKRVTGAVVRRALDGLPITRSLAEHLATTLNVDLADLVVREIEADLPRR